MTNDPSWHTHPTFTMWESRLDFLSSGYGFEIVDDPSLVNLHYSTVQRSWKERLFSWTPWRKFKVVTTAIPSEHVYREDNRLVAHPDTAEKLRAVLLRIKSGS